MSIDPPADPTESVSITVCPDGPLLVRGPAELRSVDGVVVTNPRPVIALCRCGRSRLKPLCDGSHTLSRFRDPASAAGMEHVLIYATPAGPSDDAARDPAA